MKSISTLWRYANSPQHFQSLQKFEFGWDHLTLKEIHEPASQTYKGLLIENRKHLLECEFLRWHIKGLDLKLPGEHLRRVEYMTMTENQFCF